MRLLVVEDEPDLLEAISQSLREAGYAVEEASDGRTGCTIAQKGEFDGIVLDLMLPRMTGWEMLGELRKTKQTPVLILSARDAVRDRVRGLDAGADDYLTKPFEISELLARVRSMVRRSAGGALQMAHIGQMTGESLEKTVSTLESARRIQMNLTLQKPRVQGLDLAFDYRPARMVGGDYCDAWVMQDGRLAFVVGDVAGKGLPAAMVMANVHASLHAATSFCAGPAESLNYVNQHLRQHLPDGPFVTLFLGMLDARNGQLEYVNAGHEPPLLISAEGQVAALGEPTNTVLGISAEPLAARQHTLGPGQSLVLFTDGITDAVSPHGGMFGTGRVRATLEGLGQTTPEHTLEKMNQAVALFRGTAQQTDDMTVLIVRRAEQR